MNNHVLKNLEFCLFSDSSNLITSQWGMEILKKRRALSPIVIVILLEFQPTDRYTPTHWMAAFQGETLPTDRPIYNWNILKVTVQNNVSLTRYLNSRNHSYLAKDAKISCFLKTKYIVKETLFCSVNFRIF